MPQPLKRLGGGRWETKDGRFSIEPQSGTWVVVDNEQTNELGLPLVRGPFASLTAAREAIEESRDSGAVESPLAERIERAGQAEPESGTGRKGKARSSKRESAKPEPPPEPAWLTALDGRERRQAKALIGRLEEAGVDDAERVARGQIADAEPALARLALERAIGSALAADDAEAAVRGLVDALLDGRDDALGARWRIVDGDGREIRRLDVP